MFLTGYALLKIIIIFLTAIPLGFGLHMGLNHGQRWTEWRARCKARREIKVPTKEDEDELLKAGMAAAVAAN